MSCDLYLDRYAEQQKTNAMTKAYQANKLITAKAEGNK